MAQKDGKKKSEKYRQKLIRKQAVKTQARANRTKKAKDKVFKPYKPKKICEKCGAGMAEHFDRYACGRCRYTVFKQKEVNEKRVAKVKKRK